MPSDSDEHEVVKARSTSEGSGNSSGKKKVQFFGHAYSAGDSFFLSRLATNHEWQLDVADALLLGLNCVAIAGTGSGKAIPFMLPLLLHPDKMALIILPLKVL